MTPKAKMIAWYLVLAAVGGAASFAAYRFGHPLVATLILIVPLALIVNGFVAEHEDRAEGGFSPDSPPTIHRETNQKPNQALEPTTTLVMPRAIFCFSEMKLKSESRLLARVTPSVVVAHL